MADNVSSTGDVCLYFLALFIPPLTVFFSTFTEHLSVIPHEILIRS